MKKILGLDLGSSSIGWAYVHESGENSKIIGAGVRVVPLLSDESMDFTKGNPISINKSRTVARGARRSLQRFKQRRNHLLKIFRKLGFVSSDFSYSEDGENSTYATYRLRSLAATEKVSKEDFVRILLMINKKRGYKSNRKAQNSDQEVQQEGELLDGMEVSRALIKRKITPGQYAFEMLQLNIKSKLPDFYPSDLELELERIIHYQLNFHQELPNDFLKQIQRRSKNAIYYYFNTELNIPYAENNGTKEEKRVFIYGLRARALVEKMDASELALIIGEIKDSISKANSYLGAISNRSKELIINNLTVGQYLYHKLMEEEQFSVKNVVFLREDYINEFESIWETQARYYAELTDDLKNEIRDIIIFYQRRLKSQKHLVGFCEFETKYKVVPKSSPVFQHFRMWQNINNLEVIEKKLDGISIEQKRKIAGVLMYNGQSGKKGKFKSEDLLKLIDMEPQLYHFNFPEVQVDATRIQILKMLKSYWEELGFKLPKNTKLLDKALVCQILNDLNLPLNLLEVDFTVVDDGFDKQNYLKLWHALYSIEDDASLRKFLMTNFNMEERLANRFLKISFESNYGSLSTKAMRKLIPHLEAGLSYDEACKVVYGSHSKESITKEENENRLLAEKLELIKKNSLRNPVVEKVLNQMINLVNALIASEKYGIPDEIRVEMTRQLKATNQQRQDIFKRNNEQTLENERIEEILKKDFKIARVTKNDITRYKLWEETGRFSIYTGKPIQATELFTNKYDIEHIIPKSRMFDDSFTNKTLCERELNIQKSNQTAYSFLEEKLNESEFGEYVNRVKDLYKTKKISQGKYVKLLMANKDIPDDFIKRQLNETQYITKKATEILKKVSRDVTFTSGQITAKLRQDWGLNNVLRELNFQKYRELGLTYEEMGKGGERLELIADWSKRDDHRHHAMDAITVALTKQAHIQYLNTLNAEHKVDARIMNKLEDKYLEKINGKYVFKAPMPNIRNEFKQTLGGILISIKAKNKVFTWNKNKIKIKKKHLIKIERTPRGQLHKETIYGEKKQYVVEEKNGIKTVRLDSIYTKRLEIGPDLNEKQIGKVLDKKVRDILLDRYKAFGENAKKAFGNLDEFPIYLNEEKNIKIKKVTIEAVNNVQGLHYKKDKDGKLILDELGKPILVDFVSTGNNHHVAIYEDENGKWQEEVVSFYEANIRANMGEQIVQKQHPKGWRFLFTLKQNEYFVFPAEDFNPHEIDLFSPENYPLISKHLFRVQKIATKYYVFRHHLETKIDDNKALLGVVFYRVQTPQNLKGIIKVRINHLGEIVKIGE